MESFQSGALAPPGRLFLADFKNLAGMRDRLCFSVLYTYEDVGVENGIPRLKKAQKSNRTPPPPIAIFWCSGSIK
jgi:hypothetical protein